MADERYYTIEATFDPTIKVTLDDPWTPAAAAGDDPGNMRARSLEVSRGGRFPPDVLGRRNKQTTSLVWVWTDGPIVQGAEVYVLGSDTESAPPSVQRTPAYPLTLGSDSAQVLELGPSDHLAIDSAGEETTCYIRVLDLDEAEMVTWLSNKKAKECCLPTFTRIDVENTTPNAIIDLSALDDDQVEVRVDVSVSTILRLPPWANVRPNQVINIVRAASLSDGLIGVTASGTDTIDVFGGVVYVPLAGSLKLQRSGGVGNWVATDLSKPFLTTVSAGDLALTNGWTGTRYVRLAELAAQTVSLPTYTGLTLSLPTGQRLVVCNPTASAKDISVPVGDLIVGKGVSNQTHTLAARTTAIVEFDGSTYTIV